MLNVVDRDACYCLRLSRFWLLQTQPFLFPVNQKEVPDYYKIIKRPMDLQTMREVGSFLLDIVFQHFCVVLTTHLSTVLTKHKKLVELELT